MVASAAPKTNALTPSKPAEFPGMIGRKRNGELSPVVYKDMRRNEVGAIGMIVGSTVLLPLAVWAGYIAFSGGRHDPALNAAGREIVQPAAVATRKDALPKPVQAGMTVEYK